MCDTKSYILNHIKRVQNKLFKLIIALLMRSQEHDKSKLEEILGYPSNLFTKPYQ